MNEPQNLITPALRGWLIAERYDFSDRGEVHCDGKVLSMGAGSPATGLSYQGPLPSDTYRLTWQARRTKGSDFFSGVTFPIRGSFATLIVGGWGGGVVGVSNIDNMSAVENESTQYLEFENDRWYRFELTVGKKTLAFKIDDEVYFDLKHDTHKYSVWWEQEQMTPLGIANWHTASEIKELQITAID